MIGHPDARLIVDEARNWIGTPYLHQSSVRGQGCDCLGLVRGIWRALIGSEPQAVPAYSPDWGEVGSNETMLAAANQHFEPIDSLYTAPGDLVVFRWKQTVIAKHVGIITGHHNFIHAYERSGVVETTLVTQWRRRIAAAFRFPALSK